MPWRKSAALVASDAAVKTAPACTRPASPCGDAGTGKTTGLRRLAMILVEKALNSKDERRIPVYLDAKSVLNSAKSLVKYATDVSAPLTSDSSPAFSVEELTAGHVTITAHLDPLIDSMRPAVIKELKGLLLEVRKGEVTVLDGPTEERPSAIPTP